ncbi:Virulence factor BrkB [Frankia canadensis]|uniref:Virulence factor BrkB n=1 Tax=Frankia canadensis TaxID=1836972 RepID=A0A2I2KS90_9ACTN|nr:ribonuclease BN [Frankia canadensis]SNQ48534.1 Virulence factor BrkB [Frankia canadensis]SOU55824.1 Virulence factor BrkB [Frankia canadensis]
MQPAPQFLGRRPTQGRLRGSAAEELGRRLHEGDLINGAMNLAALTLMMFFPFIITLAAVSPLRPGGAAEIVVRRMGLDHDAALAVERLFAPQGGGTARSGWTVVGVVWLVLGGLSLAAAVQSVYLRVFRVPAIGWRRGLPAQAVWLAGLIVFLAGSTAAGAVLTRTVGGQAAQAALVTLALGLFLWGGAWILVLGRLSWRELLPTAVLTTIGLTGLGVVSRLTFSSSIVQNERSYGNIGVVFTLLSWLIGLGVVLTGGAIVGKWYNESGLSLLRAFRRMGGRGRRAGHRDRAPTRRI